MYLQTTKAFFDISLFLKYLKKETSFLMMAIPLEIGWVDCIQLVNKNSNNILHLILLVLIFTKKKLLSYFKCQFMQTDFACTSPTLIITKVLPKCIIIFKIYQSKQSSLSIEHSQVNIFIFSSKERNVLNNNVMQTCSFLSNCYTISYLVHCHHYHYYNYNYPIYNSLISLNLMYLSRFPPLVSMILFGSSSLLKFSSLNPILLQQILIQLLIL